MENRHHLRSTHARASLSGLVLALGLGLLAFAPRASAQAQGPNNILSAAETAAGWKLLFNGTNNTGWIHPDGSVGKFVPEDSALRTNGGDICTQGEYESFELSVDYKYDAGGNSGIFVRTKKGIDPPWLNGMEIAVQDNGRANNLYKNGDAAVYDVFAPTKDTWLGPMKWNRIVVWLAGSKLEHWHNGSKVIDQDMSTTAWKNAVAASKFSDEMFTSNNWGKETKGQVCIQDHGPEHKIWFRNIKIRPLTVGEVLPVPLATPAGGSFNKPVDVKLEVAVVGASIHYTLDGTTPTTASPVYKSPIPVSSNMTVKAITVRAGFTASAAVTQTYNVGISAVSRTREGEFRWEVRRRGAEAGLALDLPAQGGFEAALYDARGSLMRTASGRGDKALVSLQGLQPGLYWFKVRNGRDTRLGRFAWY